MSVDKNQAVIDFLIQYPRIQNSPLFFNFVNAKDGTSQIVTSSNDVYLNRPFIDGSVRKRYTFTIITFKSVTDSALVTSTGFPNENVEDVNDVQGMMDWINEQNDLHNYPNFGNNCTIESIGTTTNEPRLDGINSDVTPMLAMYSINIQIDYIDFSKKIWG